MTIALALISPVAKTYAKVYDLVLVLGRVSVEG